MTYLSVTDVRRSSGAPSSLITDAYITSAIVLVEKEVERWINTKFSPTMKIDVLDGSGSNRIFTTKNPLLSVRSLKTNDTSVSPSNISFYRASGKIVLDDSAEAGIFIEKVRDTIIKYYYGLLEESDTNTVTISASTIGTNIVLGVSSESDFNAGDWIDIYGTDGFHESAEITTVTTGLITVDELVYTHESGSVVVKLEVPYHIKRYMEIEASLYVAINAIGSTYTFNASYSLGELSVVKGVPYTHWRESVEKLLKEREMRLRFIKPRMNIVVS